MSPRTTVIFMPRPHSSPAPTLYASDPRVAPWAGTVHGVLQAVNTYEHHEGVVRGERAERNGLKTITGDFGRLDRTTWKTLTAILDQPRPALTA